MLRWVDYVVASSISLSPLAHLSPCIDVSDGIANGNATHHFIVQEGVQTANIARSPWEGRDV